LVHKLLIELETNYAGDKFKKLLQGLEFPRGAKISINVYVTNIGESIFSGTLDSFYMTFGGAVAALNVLEQPKKKVNSLSPNVRTLLHQTIFQMSLEEIID
jgi:hypothetical protein